MRSMDIQSWIVYIYNYIYIIYNLSICYICHVYIYIYISYTHGLPGNLEHTNGVDLERALRSRLTGLAMEQVRDKVIASEWMWKWIKLIPPEKKGNIREYMIIYMVIYMGIYIYGNIYGNIYGILMVIYIYGTFVVIYGNLCDNFLVVIW